jgi:hypothetical protein
MGGGTTGKKDYKRTINRYRSGLSDFHTEAIDMIEQGGTSWPSDSKRLASEATRLLSSRTLISFVSKGAESLRIGFNFDASAVRGVLVRAQTA